MKQLILALLFLSVFTSCSESKKKESLKEPQEIKGGLETSSPKKEGFNIAKLQDALANVSENNPKLDGLLIMQNGKLIVEQYFNGYTAQKPHKVWSITKMVTGTVLGIAVDKGLISEKDSIYKHLGKYAESNFYKEKGITVEHLITMTSGYDWSEMGGRKSAGFRLPYTKDWVKFVLSLPHTHKPGTKFNYSTGNSIVLAPIIKNATQKQTRKFAKEHLFSHLNIENYEWHLQSEFWSKTQGDEIPNIRKPKPIDYNDSFAALTNTGSGLLLLPRDMCKLGQLYLDSGVWNGKQILSKSWIKKSTQPHFNNKNYGYHWRLMTFEGFPCYYATGFGLQRIFVFPTLQTVVVTTQQHYTSMSKGNKLTNELLKNIINSIEK